MQTTPVGADELLRVKALLLRQIPLSEAERRRDRARADRPDATWACRSMSRPLPRGATSRSMPRRCRRRSSNGCGRGDLCVSAKARRRNSRQPTLGLSA